MSVNFSPTPAPTGCVTSSRDRGTAALHGAGCEGGTELRAEMNRSEPQVALSSLKVAILPQIPEFQIQSIRQILPAPSLSGWGDQFPALTTLPPSWGLWQLHFKKQNTKQSKYVSTDEWVNKTWYIYKQWKYYSALKGRKFWHMLSMNET